MKRIFTFLSLAVLSLTAFAQTEDTLLSDAIQNYFNNYRIDGYHPAQSMQADSFRVDEQQRLISIFANEPFYSQPFTPQSVNRIYREIPRLFPQPYNTYRVVVFGRNSQQIEDLIPNIYRTAKADANRLWGEKNYNGNPWVQNTSAPYAPTKGLANRHLMIWPSHGRYFRDGSWQWQRPYLYCTTEDMFTQSFVYPYLFPMLENAGAIIYCPRERDIQQSEAIVDNDRPHLMGDYSETSSGTDHWATIATGFSTPTGLLVDSIQPFSLGTARTIAATTKKFGTASATWTPRIPHAGRYAVYVSYSSQPNSVPDAHYTVYHKGQRTQFKVNQKMGGSTWVYLGTFDFDEGENWQSRVVLSNQSNYSGVVTADGVRFGGGFSQNERGNAGTSGLPRFLEAARYQAQWAGLPDSLYNTENGANDYNDDLRVRGNFTNWLSAGSIYNPNPTYSARHDSLHVPTQQSQKLVPLELALAIHSDAGVRKDRSIFGTLGICTTTLPSNGDTYYNSGLSRYASQDLANILVSTLTNDLSAYYDTTWTRREVWDRNYAETRMPEIPSAILEIMSHQNFSDMKFGHDPSFKFQLSRSIYKSLLRFVNYEHGIKDCIVQPLPIHQFSALLSEKDNTVQLSWQPTTDKLEPSAVPTDYIVYTAVGDGAFDNGRLTQGKTSLTLPISPGRQYNFKVTAVNAGGQSMPSEVLSVYKAAEATAHLLIVNGFDRVSGPAWVERNDSLGFDLREDIGVPYLYTTAFCGRQTDFTHPEAGNNSSAELQGKTLAGNTFDYPMQHGQAIAAARKYSFSSVSREAAYQTDWNKYDLVDYIAGLQRDVPYNLSHYKTFDEAMQKKMSAYAHHGGNLLVSGAYIGRDMQQGDERNFLKDVLKVSFAGIETYGGDSINGLNLQIPIYRDWNAEHYALQNSDVLIPASSDAFSAFSYADKQSAGVAYKGRRRAAITMGFPFTSIKGTHLRSKAMNALLTFLLSK